MKLSSLQLEQSFLGGLIRNSEVFYEVDSLISEIDFTNDVNGTIFSIIRQICHSKEKLDKIMLGQKIKNLGISFQSDVEIFDYIDSISLAPCSSEATIKYARELKNFSIRRDLKQMAQNIITTVSANPEADIDQIISQVDAIYGDKVHGLVTDGEVKNIFEDIQEFIEEKAKDPKDDVGISVTYKEFSRLYGGLRNGNLYAIVARPAMGKSTFLVDISLNAHITNPNVKVLYLDTEMFSEDVKLRIAAAKTGIPFWAIDSGNWKKDIGYSKKMYEFFKQFKSYNFHHHCVGNKNTDQICSLIRRWYYSKVGRGNPALICYDYVKMTGEKMSNNWAEHQAIGEKIDKLKKISEEINCPLFTAMQMNRTGESFNKSAGSFSDDASAISLSDRMSWFASYVGIFRRKTLEEIQRDTPEFGSHKLITLKTRFQGKDAKGHLDLLKRKNDHGDDKYVSNYINFDVKNFKVEEKGSLEQIIEKENQQYTLNDPNKNDGELL
jgi:replicative DNA helicase